MYSPLYSVYSVSPQTVNSHLHTVIYYCRYFIPYFTGVARNFDWERPK